MKVFYTLKGNIYNAADVELALQCAEAASTQYGWPVRALIETLQQKVVFAGVQGFSWCGSSQFKCGSITGDVTTRRQFRGGAGEIIVAICPTIQLLQATQLYSTRIKLLVVVPEMDYSVCPSIYHWLDLYSATDIQRKTTMNGIGIPVTGIKRAIAFLMDYCQQYGIDITHLSVQTGKMTDVVNTIKKQGIIANNEEVVKFCLQRGLSYSEADILAKAFSTKSLLATRGNPDYDLYWQSINDPKWD